MPLNDQDSTYYIEKFKKYDDFQQLTCEKLSGIETKIEVILQRIESIEQLKAEHGTSSKEINEMALNIQLYNKDVLNLAASNKERFEMTEKRIEMIEDRQMKMGERIGAIETKPDSLKEDKIKRFDNIWKLLVSTVTTALIGMLIGYFASGGMQS